MASPRSISTRSESLAERRYRRSAFNGAKQLSAAQAPHRRLIVVLILLALALVAGLVVAVSTYLSSGSETQFTTSGVPIHPAAH